MARRWLPWLACLFLLFAGCASEEAPSESPEATSPVSTEPRIEVARPKDKSTVKAGDLEVQAFVDNFSVVNKLGKDPVDGEGHIHFYIDVKELPTTQGEPAVTGDESTYHASAKTSHTWKDVEPGKHTVGLQLVQNNHWPLETPVTAQVTVTVK